ncbi:MAG: hypothetical protein U0031_06860 [Thermomicrobiales bacterium]
MAAVLTVQWAAWVYAIPGPGRVRAWGWDRDRCPPGTVVGRQRPLVARPVAAELRQKNGETGFHRVCSRTGDDWGKMADWVGLKTNATLTASHT